MSSRNEEAPSVGALRASESVINFEVNHMSNAIAISTENNSGMSFATLIPVRIGELAGEIVQLCNARDIHICLKVRSRFNDWIARRIAEYGFVEDVDFTLVTRGKVTKGRGGDRRSREYDVTIDMAKELAMVERTEIGQRIRRYFIQCEKALRKLAPETADDILRRALNPQQQLELAGKVHGKVAMLPKDKHRAGYCELWWQLKSRHQVAQYRDIPQAEFGDACQFVEEFVWEGEWLGKEPARPEIHFPIEEWKARNPHQFSQDNPNSSDLVVGYCDLLLSKYSPCLELLDKLAAAGHCVDGAYYEFRSYQNLLRQMDITVRLMAGSIKNAFDNFEGDRRRLQVYPEVKGQQVKGEGRMVA